MRLAVFLFSAVVFFIQQQAASNSLNCPPPPRFGEASEGSLAAVSHSLGRVYLQEHGGNAAGTASVISKVDGLAITAFHVLRNKNDVDLEQPFFVEFPSIDVGERLKARIVYHIEQMIENDPAAIDKPRDIALLQFEKRPIAIPELELSPRAIEEVPNYRNYGFASHPHKASNDVGRPSLQGRCTYHQRSRTISGDSGGPIISREGLLSGVMIQNLAQDDMGVFVPVACFGSDLIGAEADGLLTFRSSGWDKVVSLLRSHKHTQPPLALQPPRLFDMNWISNLDLMRFVHEWQSSPSKQLKVSNETRCYLKSAINHRLGFEFYDDYMEAEFKSSRTVEPRIVGDESHPSLSVLPDAATPEAGGLPEGTNNYRGENTGDDEVSEEKLNKRGEKTLSPEDLSSIGTSLLQELQLGGESYGPVEKDLARNLARRRFESAEELFASISSDSGTLFSKSRLENLLSLAQVQFDLGRSRNDGNLYIAANENANIVLENGINNGLPDIEKPASVLITQIAAVVQSNFRTTSNGIRNDSIRKSGVQNEILRYMKNPNDWIIQTGDYTSQRYSKLDSINRENVKELQASWTFSTGVLRGHEGSPLVIGDTMFVHTPFPNIVYALDLNRSGAIKWKYEPEQDPDVVAVMCCDTVHRGLAFANGKVFLHQADTTIVALDAQTGKVKWSAINGDPKKGETNVATVLPVKDKVIVGVSGGEFGVRSHVTAYNIETGERVWRAYSMGPDEDILFDPEKTTVLGKPVGLNSSLRSWEGDQWRVGGGETSGWYSYDPSLDLLYYGTGNPSSWNAAQRPGDNRWASSIIARNPDDGVAAWVYQTTPHDEWDFDSVNEMILTDQMFQGEMRKLLTHFNENGFAYTLDRLTGELLLAEKYDPAVNWATEIVLDPSSESYGRPSVVARYSTVENGEDVVTTGVCPSAMGAKEQQPAAYSPRTRLFYVPTNHVCMDYEPFAVSYSAGQPYVGATLSMYPAPDSHGGMGNFVAWDNVEGKIVWSVPEDFSIWSGALVTAGDVVFYGTLDGFIKAVDAYTGDELYKFKTPSGVIGNVMTYKHDGRQYIAVLSGIGGWAGIGLAAGLTDPNDGLGAVGGYTSLSNYTALGGQLTVFSLP